MFFITTLNFYLALAGLGLTVVTLVLAVDLFLGKGNNFKEIVNRFAWLAIAGATVGSVVMSLVYSEYFGIVPCSLCWLQRIAIYPQALLSVVAWRMGDGKYFPRYGITLSLFGLLVASYQYIYQLIPPAAHEAGIMPCLADGSADCATKVIYEFGFVTFPYLSAVTFAFLIVIYLYVLRHRD